MQRELTPDDFIFIKKNRTKLSVSDLAKSLGMPETDFVHALLVHCYGRGIDFPKMLLKSKPTEQKKAKILKRRTTEEHIRVGLLCLRQAGLGEVMRFKSFVDPDRRIVVIAAEDSIKATTTQDALAEIFPKPGRPRRTLSRSEQSRLPAIIN